MITPHKFILTSGSANSQTRINAFDEALMRVGVSDFNHVTVSSILPKECKLGNIEDVKELIPGSIMHCVMSRIESDRSGDVISSAIACAKTKETVGVVAEYSGHCTKEASLERAKEICKKMIEKRNATIDKMYTTSSQLTVNGFGCCVSLCLLLY